MGAEPVTGDTIMICLTGDLHHSSLQTGNQQHCDITELQTARQYLDLLADAGVKVTFFISGKCFTEEPGDAVPIAAHPLVEVGGHNFDCFQRELWHRVWNKLINSYNGPAWYQRRDARKTIDAIRSATDVRIQSWRNHMYMHGPYTERVLAQCGISVCSDGVRRDANGMTRHPAGIWDFPINVMPDHEHLYHAERTREWVAWWQKRYNWSDDYGPDSYEIEEWTDRVLDELRDHEERGVLSNMIVHPLTMYLCDRFESFKRILAFLADHKTVHVSEVRARADADVKGDAV